MSEGIQQHYSKTGKIEEYIIEVRQRVGKIPIARFMTQQALGKALPSKAHIHHYYDELVICEDAKYHELLHTRQRAFEITGDPHKRSCAYCHQFDDVKNLHEAIKRNRASQFYHPFCHNNYMRPYMKNWRKERKECLRKI